MLDPGIPIKPLPRRDYLAILFGLGGVTTLCWIYLIRMAEAMSGEAYLRMAALQIRDWSPSYFWMVLTMWVVMMIGMMLPSAMPMILIYAAIGRKAAKASTPVPATAFFAAGYLSAWALFSLLATLIQWQLDRLALLSPAMVSNSPYFGALLLVAAGVYQWLPMKDQCLEHCQAPAHFISRHWRAGSLGALVMGAHHGLFCMGCCWLIMCLLFVGGVMNVLWIALITIFVLLEKILPFGRWTSRLSGAAMIAGGAYFMAAYHLR